MLYTLFRLKNSNGKEICCRNFANTHGKTTELLFRARLYVPLPNAINSKHISFILIMKNVQGKKFLDLRIFFEIVVGRV